MTYTEVAEALKSGRDRVIVATGGIEQNGPHVVLGKHNMMVYEPSSIRLEQRQDDHGGVVIKGHRFQSSEELRALGQKIINRRVKQTVEAINSLE